MKARLCVCLCTLLAACSRGDGEYIPQIAGDPQRGRLALQEFDCGACHVIPGVSGAESYVGPPLDAYARRVYVAGKFPNTPEYLVPWIMNAPSMAPLTAMPAFAMSEAQARDMAAYLYTLH